MEEFDEDEFFREYPEYKDWTHEDSMSEEERSRAWYLTFMSLEEYEAMLDYNSRPTEELGY